MSLSEESMAYQAMLEALRHCPVDSEAYAELAEDVEKARRAVEVAWLARL